MSPVSVKPRAVAFVDFEHWFISMDKIYHEKPDYKGWYADVAEQFDIAEIYFFADFSNQSLRNEIPRIREITNFVIETQNSSSYHKKDYTDFIMLDHIYQRAMAGDEIDTYIIFSGDGHFSSVVNFLCVKQSKNVGIYAVRDATSSTLRNAATWTREVPLIDRHAMTNYKLILGTLCSLEDAQKGKKKKQRPAFWPTVDAVANHNGLGRDDIADSLRQLIEKEYVFQTSEKIGNKTIKVLNVDRDKARRDGLII